MKLRHSIVLAAVCYSGAIAPVLADCAGASVAEVKESYAAGQRHEREGKLAAALFAYHAATEYTCEANPVASAAAQRAAALAPKVAGEFEKKRDFERAFDAYNAGGHYASADRALMALVRAKPDDPSAFEKARSALEYRMSPAFQSNNEVAIATVGPYKTDPALLPEVLTMPAKGVERALQKEKAAFNEQYLREFVQLIQSQPDDPTDMAAMQRAAAAHQAFAQKWPSEPIEASRDAFSLVHRWMVASPDRAWGEKIDVQRKQLLEQRVATLTRNYAGAPKLLEAAIDYLGALNLEDAVFRTRMAAIHTQAERLGDEASAKQRYNLAAEYYGVARQDEKAQAARDKMQQIAMAKMQPQIDQARQNDEAMKQQLSDPAKVKAMQEQAEAMRKSLEAQQKANAQSNKKKADDLEAELGM
jgi:hypothetical protein